MHIYSMMVAILKRSTTLKKRSNKRRLMTKDMNIYLVFPGVQSNNFNPTVQHPCCTEEFFLYNQTYKNAIMRIRVCLNLLQFDFAKAQRPF